MKHLFSVRSWVVVICLVLSLVIGILVAKLSILFLIFTTSLLALAFLINRPSLFFYLTLISILAGQLVRISVSSDQSGAVLLIDAILLLNIFAWVINKIKHQQALVETPINKWIVIFIGISLVSLIFAGRLLLFNEWIRASWYLVRWVMYATFFFIALDEIKAKNKLIKVIGLIIAIGVGIAILGILQYIFFPNFSAMAAKAGWDPHMYRVLSVFFDPNYTGGFLAIILTLILSLVIKLNKTRIKLWLILASVPIIVAFILTYSRSAYLALFFMILVIFIFQARKLFLIFLILMIVGLTVIYSNDKIYQRIQKRIEGAQNIDVTASARIKSWSNAWQIISDQPIVGIGFNAYSVAQEQYGFLRNLKSHASGGSDSSLLNIWAMTGIFGLITYLLIYFGVVLQSYRLISNREPLLSGLGLGFLANLAGLLVFSQFVNALFYPFFMILFWLLAALIFGGQKVFKHEK